MKTFQKRIKTKCEKHKKWYQKQKRKTKKDQYQNRICREKAKTKIAKFAINIKKRACTLLKKWQKQS